MPYTRVHAIKQTLNKTLDYIEDMDKTTIIPEKDDLQDAIDYIGNDEKTQEHVFVEGYMCNPEFAELQFTETKDAYVAANGGRERNTTGTPTIAWHLIQSFPPEERDINLIHQIGMELAEKMEGGKYQAVVSTHVEGSNCIHNHIVFNAYPMDANQTKYHRSNEAYSAVKALSDVIADSYGLSVILADDIENKGMAYSEWAATQNGTSWKQQVRQEIDSIKAVCSDWDEYKKAMQAVGYVIEERPAYVKYTPPGKERPIRDKTLGAAYTKEALVSGWSLTPQKTPSAAKEKKAYDTEERKRWKAAQQLANLQSKQNHTTRDNTGIRISAYDKDGRKCSSTQFVILSAIKTINSDHDLFLDVAGTGKYPTNPIYAPKDWKLQQMVTSLKVLSDYNIEEPSDVGERIREIRNQMALVSKEIRTKQYYLSKVDNLYQALEAWEETKDVIAALDKLPDAEKDAFKAEHDEDVKKYNKAMAIFNKASGKKSKNPPLVYSREKRRRVVCQENIDTFAANYVAEKEAVEVLKGDRSQLGKQYGQIKRLEYSLSLAQHDLFTHGPRYSKEKLDEIHAKAKEAEQQVMQSKAVVREIGEDDFQSYLDAMLKTNSGEYNLNDPRTNQAENR